VLDKHDPLRGLFGIFLALALALIIGWLLVVGESLILPILIAVISVYVLVTASEALTRIPGCGRLPQFIRRAIVLILFLLIFIALGGMMIVTASQINLSLPDYQENIITLLSTTATKLGFDNPDWSKMWHEISSRFSVQQVLSNALSSVSAAAGLISMVMIYASFLMGERDGFAHKVAVALPKEQGKHAESIIRNINTAIGDYLTVKTLVNIILGTISFVIMWILDIDFALFWAVIIALLNYIPYVGSLLGVAFPVLLSIAQFGSFTTTIALAVLLTAAQTWVGNALEPRMIGRKVNMSPFVVLVALSFWSALWGIAGAILAIPLTSIIAIVMASFQSTRPIAVLLAQDVSVFENKDAV
jgi:predicted PurR-regulated permease PerM